MNGRPPSITVISWLFILAGGIGFLYHLSELTSRRSIDAGLVGVCLVRLVAILSGIFMLRGSNWARWLLIRMDGLSRRPERIPFTLGDGHAHRPVWRRGVFPFPPTVVEVLSRDETPRHS